MYVMSYRPFLLNFAPPFVSHFHTLKCRADTASTHGSGQRRVEVHSRPPSLAFMCNIMYGYFFLPIDFRFAPCLGREVWSGSVAADRPPTSFFTLAALVTIVWALERDILL